MECKLKGNFKDAITEDLYAILWTLLMLTFFYNKIKKRYKTEEITTPNMKSNHTNKQKMYGKRRSRRKWHQPHGHLEIRQETKRNFKNCPAYCMPCSIFYKEYKTIIMVLLENQLSHLATVLCQKCPANIDFQGFVKLLWHLIKCTDQLKKMLPWLISEVMYKLGIKFTHNIKIGKAYHIETKETGDISIPTSTKDTSDAEKVADCLKSSREEHVLNTETTDSDFLSDADQQRQMAKVVADNVTVQVQEEVENLSQFTFMFSNNNETISTEERKPCPIHKNHLCENTERRSFTQVISLGSTNFVDPDETQLKSVVQNESEDTDFSEKTEPDTRQKILEHSRKVPYPKKKVNEEKNVDDKRYVDNEKNVDDEENIDEGKNVYDEKNIWTKNPSDHLEKSVHSKSKLGKSAEESKLDTNDSVTDNNKNVLIEDDTQTTLQLGSFDRLCNVEQNFKDIQQKKCNVSQDVKQNLLLSKVNGKDVIVNCVQNFPGISQQLPDNEVVQDCKAEGKIKYSNRAVYPDTLKEAVDDKAQCQIEQIGESCETDGESSFYIFEDCEMDWFDLLDEPIIPDDIINIFHDVHDEEDEHHEHDNGDNTVEGKYSHTMSITFSQSVVSEPLQAYSGTKEGVQCTEMPEQSLKHEYEESKKQLYMQKMADVETVNIIPAILNNNQADSQDENRNMSFDSLINKKMDAPESDVPYLKSWNSSQETEQQTDSCFLRYSSISDILPQKKGTETEFHLISKNVTADNSYANFQNGRLGTLNNLRRIFNLSSDVTSEAWRRLYSVRNNLDVLPFQNTSQNQQNHLRPQPQVAEEQRVRTETRIPQTDSNLSGISRAAPNSVVEQNSSEFATQPSGFSLNSSEISAETFTENSSFSSSATSAMSGLFSNLSSGSHDEVLKYEWARFRSFWSFPLECPANPTRLARQGWYYEGNGDETVCFCCKVKHAHWRLGEDIDAVHARISPNCPFINRRESGNVPIHGSSVPSVPANTEQGATGGATASTVIQHDFHRNVPTSDHEPTSLLTRNLQLGGGGNQGSATLTLGAGFSQNTPSRDTQHQQSSTSTATTVQQNQADRAPSDSSRTGTPKVLAQPTSTPAIFLQSSTPSSPQVNQPPQTGAAIPQPQVDHILENSSSQRPPNQQHPTTPRQRIEERQRQLQLAAQRRHAEIQRRQEEERQQANPQSANASALGINTERPRYPNYAIVTVRAGTFGGFPSYLDQTPMQMAKAGFFYAGYGDYVRCFFCGGGLRNWEPGDDPWVEHARWFPRCAFVKQNKGQTFINLVLQRQREMLLPNISVPTEAQPQLPEAGVARSVDMQSSAVQSIKEMGYGDSIIERAVTMFRARRGHDIPLTAQPLLEILFTLNNEYEETPLDIPPGSRQGETAQTVQNTPSQGQTQTSHGQTPGTLQNRLPAANTGQGQRQPPSPPRQQAVASSSTGEGASGSTQTKQTSVEQTLTGASSDDDPSKVLSVEELKSIQEENLALKEQMKCKICMDNNVCISFLPCGHLCCCAECAPAMVRCPICRHIIKGSVKTYLS